MTGVDVRTYKVPPAFYDDHVSRDCDGGRELRRNSKHVVVELDRDAYDDLHSDCVYFATLDAEAMGTDEYRGVLGLQRSAAAMLKRLEEVGAPDPIPADERAHRDAVVAAEHARYAKWCAEQAIVERREREERAAVRARERAIEDLGDRALYCIARGDLETIARMPRLDVEQHRLVASMSPLEAVFALVRVQAESRQSAELKFSSIIHPKEQA